MSEWKTIESAPKDMMIDLLLHDPTFTELQIGFFHLTDKEWLTHEMFQRMNPTHWHPLPEPPVLQSLDVREKPE